MVRISGFVLCALMGVSCSRKSAAPSSAANDEAPKVSAEELTAPSGHLALGNVALEENGKPALVLASDGTLEDKRENRILGKLSSDGRFVDDSGKLRATLTAAGEVELPGGDFLPVTIGNDGSVNLLKEQRTLRLQKDGSLSGANPDGPVVKLTGVTEKTRRAAMFVLVLAAFPQPRNP